ncbi:OV-16 antigen-like isoform X2 [Bemisia tabaci]|uniref:OV-16 antigen-like isoform X2 n=1 Tax=Bemisia tabaci TaxID=7038 RepID=UPI003B28B043
MSCRNKSVVLTDEFALLVLNLLLRICLHLTVCLQFPQIWGLEDYDYLETFKDRSRDHIDRPDSDEDDYPWSWIDWTDINSEFHTKEIIPDVVSKAPEWPVKVHYSFAPVDFGNKYVPLEFKWKPRRVIWKAEEGCFYTLIVTGPDCPSQPQPTKREWQHWLVVNIPGGDWQNGETLTEYAGVSMLYKQGEHRIVYLVYKQPENKTMHFDEERLTDSSSCNLKRSKFKTMRFVKKYNLGDPVAGNFCWLRLEKRSSPYFIYDDTDDFCRKIKQINFSEFLAQSSKLSTRKREVKLTTLKMKITNKPGVLKNTSKPL